ncbi:HNH nuclease [Klebsormidium nitens]|uniref:HNH nuclease n=1 Tax=Klebsormidium nitens TaxID=105231 RepID=A0A1Y1ILH1_KLENI|nr:HNH nuclease [Klebsormidium nitens]|eukprot:GAQ91644.1 HNH nuclease [Klebsormidium nitens]
MDGRLGRFEQLEQGFVEVPEGLMHLLEERLTEGKTESKAVICMNVDHFGCLRGEDEGWGCGWRNIQMYLSNLLRNEEICKHYPGKAVVPDIACLQQWLEAAWNIGFDVEGADQLDWKIVGTSKWIGTTECAVILRSMGVRACIVQFDAAAAIKLRAGNVDDDVLETSVVTGSGQKDNVKKNMCARCNKTLGKHYYKCNVKDDYNVCGDCKKALDKEFAKQPVGRLNHFIRVEAPDSNSDDADNAAPSKGGEAPSQLDPKRGVRHTRLFEWVWRYFTDGLKADEKWKDGNCRQPQVRVVDKPPLYFQQQGHSRTIVGVRKVRERPGAAEETWLLILEPCEETSEVADMLRRKDPKWRQVLEFGEKELWKPVYQICYVKPGLAKGDQLEKLKVLSSIYKEWQDVLTASLDKYGGPGGLNAAEDASRSKQRKRGEPRRLRTDVAVKLMNESDPEGNVDEIVDDLDEMRFYREHTTYWTETLYSSSEVAKIRALTKWIAQGSAWECFLQLEPDLGTKGATVQQQSLMASSTAATSVTAGVKRKRGQVADTRRFVCNVVGCGETFTDKRYLTRHSRSHSEQNAPPASYDGWKQHYKFMNIYGLPDGSVWSCEVGRFLKGRFKSGYIQFNINGQMIQRHRLNFEIAHGRAISPGMEIDHIIPSPKPEDGSERPLQNDSWANLQELTRPEHQRKTARDNPGSGQKRSVTGGFPIIVRHVASSKEERYSSIRDAASTLGLDRKTMQKCIQGGSSKEYGGYMFFRCSVHVVDQADRPSEEWKDAKLDGRVLRSIRVSSLGRVQLSNGRRTEGNIVCGRHKVELQIAGKRVTVCVYNLMAHTFIGPPPSDEHTVDHIDGICDQDVIWNLRWATRVEQNRNRTINRAVRKHDLEGKLLQTYSTIAEAAEKNDLSWQQVDYATRMGSTATGFLWTKI